MPRVLQMTERRVAFPDRASYLAALRRRRAHAARAQVHLWAFEHADDPERFVEFVEGSDPAAVRAVGDDSALWLGVAELS